MLIKTGIYLCLLIFIFQAIVFNSIISSAVFFAKIDKEGYKYDFTFSREAFKKLNWQNETEFIFGNYLVDVKDVKQEKNSITALCKVDLKEKDFLEKLSGFFKQTKNKKITFFAFNVAIPGQYRIKKTDPGIIIRHKDFLFSFTTLFFPKTSPPPKA